MREKFNTYGFADYGYPPLRWKGTSRTPTAIGIQRLVLKSATEKAQQTTENRTRLSALELVKPCKPKGGYERVVTWDKLRAPLFSKPVGRLIVGYPDEYCTALRNRGPGIRAYGWVQQFW